MSLELMTPTPTSVRVSRAITGSQALVWQAHSQAELLKRWMNGPETHTLPVCELDLRVGGTGRFVWKSPDLEMGMSCEFVELIEGEKIVQIETFDAWPDSPSTVTIQLSPCEGGTRITVDIDYGDESARDDVIASGFDQGYEASFRNLERLVAELEAHPA